jgi:16S rRNA (uracil1498-N3)-methyltransferase
LEYYYTPKEYISSSSLTIVDDEVKHLKRVLRKNAGDEIYVTDGLGNLYKTKISNVNKEIIECDILERSSNLNEPKIRLTLFQSLLKNPDRFEFVIEKATELGAYEIQPIITENVINKTANKTERWKAIALSAMKQSQRCFLPAVKEPVIFKDAVQAQDSDIKLIADERHYENTIDLKSISHMDGSAALFIGPEGGFSNDEIEIAIQNSCKVLNLGSRKYRSETAAIISAGLLLINTF